MKLLAVYKRKGISRKLDGEGRAGGIRVKREVEREGANW